MSMYPEAIASVEKAMTIAGRIPLLIATLGRAYALSGRKDEPEILLQELQDKGKSEYVLPMFFAALYRDLGHTDEAFRWLEKVYQERHYGMFLLGVPSLWEPPGLTVLPRHQVVTVVFLLHNDITPSQYWPKHPGACRYLGTSSVRKLAAPRLLAIRMEAAPRLAPVEAIAH